MSQKKNVIIIWCWILGAFSIYPLRCDLHGWNYVTTFVLFISKSQNVYEIDFSFISLLIFIYFLFRFICNFHIFKLKTDSNVYYVNLQVVLPLFLSFDLNAVENYKRVHVFFLSAFLVWASKEWDNSENYSNNLQCV